MKTVKIQRLKINKVYIGRIYENGKEVDCSHNPNLQELKQELERRGKLTCKSY